MRKDPVTFNDMAGMMVEIHDTVQNMWELLQKQMKKDVEAHPEDAHKRVSMSVDDLAVYLCMPAKTVYDKLKKGDIPAYKPGKHWVAYKDEVDAWLETTRRNPAVQTDEEMEAELSGLCHTRSGKEAPQSEDAGIREEHTVTVFDGQKVPPTLDEVQAYITANSLNVDARVFHSYYSERGWLASGGSPVRNWIALLNSWEKRK